MRKVLLGLFLSMAVGVLGRSPAFALSPSEFTADISTYAITNAAHIAAQVSGAIAIEQLWFSNSSTATAQTVSVYKLCQSTTTATLVFRGYIPTGTAWNTLHLNYPLFNTPLNITDVCFRKSATGSSVQVNVHYR